MKEEYTKRETKSSHLSLDERVATKVGSAACYHRIAY
jgi:hypothetical protein